MSLDLASVVLVLALGMAAGASLAWAAGRHRTVRIADLEATVAARDASLTAAAERLRIESSSGAALAARLEEQQRALEAERRLGDTFKALSADALRASSESFLLLAGQALDRYQEGARGDLEKRQQAIGELVAPVREALGRFEVHVGALERTRASAYAELREQIRSMGEGQALLRTEASNLVRALRAPQVRGRWGEVQLKRVVELAGMAEHCDFTEQHSVDSADGRLRPDLVVRLPGGRTVVVDAKAPLAAYLEAMEATDEVRRTALLVDHARQVRDHVMALSRKAYWEQFRPTPEFVVLFLPGESFFSAALEQDRDLIEAGAERRVILATPTTLISLLKAVSYGWKQETVAANAERVAEMGREIHKRVADLAAHVVKLGRHLAGSVESYNAFVGSLESRVLTTARRFRELEAAGAEIVPEISPVESVTRVVQAPELTASAPEK
jgi:DNA recombination protein RmuC